MPSKNREYNSIDRIFSSLFLSRCIPPYRQYLLTAAQYCTVDNCVGDQELEAVHSFRLAALRSEDRSRFADSALLRSSAKYRAHRTSRMQAAVKPRVVSAIMIHGEVLK